MSMKSACSPFLKIFNADTQSLQITNTFAEESLSRPFNQKYAYLSGVGGVDF